MSGTRRVLVVEDDEAIRLVLTTLLHDEGHHVVAVATGEDALVAIHDRPIDAALIDLRLPGIQGLDLVRSLRAGGSLPIIIVTAQADSHDVVIGLEAGADDYVTKPFVPKELAARLRAQMRKGTPAHEAGERMGWGDLELHPATAEAYLEGQLVALSRTEFFVLAELVMARGKVVSRSELLRRVWGYSNAGDGRVVDNLVYRLRSKIERDASNPEHIVTVRGFGYRMKQ